jgi:hypothetical protein
VTAHGRALAFVHASVVLWGFTAILGKLISLPAAALVWWRMLLVAGMLAMLPRVWRGLAAMPLRLMLTLAAIGIVVALHWLTFYASIKLANASVAATCGLRSAAGLSGRPSDCARRVRGALVGGRALRGNLCGLDGLAGSVGRANALSLSALHAFASARMTGSGLAK